MPSHPNLRIGIDIGGTFTDFVIYDPDSGQINTFKLLSTPGDPAEAVLEGLRRIVSPNHEQSGLSIVHGSTVATNALLERKGASTALVATRGFRDVLEIRRQNRPSLYDFSIDPPVPLVSEHLRFEVDERVDQSGQVLVALDPSQADALIPELVSQEIGSVAVCLLFSFLHPAHEAAIAQRLRSAGFFVSASSEILPEFREYERTSTTVVNAYVSPILDRYLSRLDAATGRNQINVMQSNGGMISLQEARRVGVRCILSGPAGGVVGSRFVAENLANSIDQIKPSFDGDNLRVLTFDMGGTSTDVSLIAGAPRLTTESEIAGLPIAIPMLDIHTIGAGGGSIARVDLGGALRVGPESAGADPGPACYAIGSVESALPTVTDANLVLGRLDPENFLGGRMLLDNSRAGHVISVLGDQLNLDPVQTALGVVEIANVHMERALRLISVERGYDPRDFTLLSFGGAGGLHAGDLARRLGIPVVLIPPVASTLSAFGMLAADVVKDYALTIMLPDKTPPSQIASTFTPLIHQAIQEMADEGVPPEQVSIERLVDVRYLGQSFELTMDFDPDLRTRFHQAHEKTYGYSHPDAPLEFVNIRVRAVGQVDSPVLTPSHPADSDPSPALSQTRTVAFGEGKINTPFYRWELLKPGNRIQGPALIIREDTTVLIHPGDDALVDVYDNLIMRIGG